MELRLSFFAQRVAQVLSNTVLTTVTCCKDIHINIAQFFAHLKKMPNNPIRTIIYFQHKS